MDKELEKQINDARVAARVLRIRAKRIKKEERARAEERIYGEIIAQVPELLKRAGREGGRSFDLYDDHHRSRGIGFRWVGQYEPPLVELGSVIDRVKDALEGMGFEVSPVMTGGRCALRVRF